MRMRQKRNRAATPRNREEQHPLVKPGQPKEKSPRVVTEFVCPDCGKPLLYRQGTSKAGKPYEMFSCSGYPQCRASFWGDDGKPDFTRRPK